MTILTPPPLDPAAAEAASRAADLDTPAAEPPSPATDAIPRVTPAAFVSEEARAAEQEATNAGVARATGVLALGNIASRVLGLAREVALTNLYGAGRAVDAFNIAVIVPKTLYDLLIAGHVNSAIVPVLSDVVTRDGQRALWGLVSILLNLITAIVAGLTLLIIAFAPAVIGFVSGGASPETAFLAADLLRITAPALIFLSAFAVLSGSLYALRSFTLPAFAGAIFNGAIVLTTVIGAPAPLLTVTLSGARAEWLAARAEFGIEAAAVGWLVGALAQLMLQLPGLRGARLHFSFDWRHPAVRQIALLYLPVMFSLVLDMGVRAFSYNLASQTGEGSISYMNWATTLIQFPQGLVATAISVAILPTLARQAVLIPTAGDTPFKDTLGLGLRLAITLILPAAIGLFALATPIIGLLFEHGAFSPQDTLLTGLALRLYLIGLPFAAVDLLLVYAFYARKDTTTPALIGLVSLIVYMAAALLLVPQFGLFSLMVADSVKHITHAAASAYLLHRRIGGFGRQRVPVTFIKTATAAVLCGLAARTVVPILERALGGGGLPREIILVTISGGVSVIVFVAAALLLRVDEVRWLSALVVARVRRR